MNNLLTEVGYTLFSFWKYDMEVFSSPNTYKYIVPIIFYLPFFFIKWTIITVPVWLPVRLMFVGFGSNNTSKEGKS